MCWWDDIIRNFLNSHVNRLRHTLDKTHNTCKMNTHIMVGIDRLNIVRESNEKRNYLTPACTFCCRAFQWEYLLWKSVFEILRRLWTDLGWRKEKKAVPHQALSLIFWFVNVVMALCHEQCSCRCFCRASARGHSYSWSSPDPSRPRLSPSASPCLFCAGLSREEQRPPSSTDCKGC